MKTWLLLSIVSIASVTLLAACSAEKKTVANKPPTADAVYTKSAVEFGWIEVSSARRATNSFSVFLWPQVEDYKPTAHEPQYFQFVQYMSNLSNSTKDMTRDIVLYEKEKEKWTKFKSGQTCPTGSCSEMFDPSNGGKLGGPDGVCDDYLDFNCDGAPAAPARVATLAKGESSTAAFDIPPKFRNYSETAVASDVDVQGRLDAAYCEDIDSFTPGVKFEDLKLQDCESVADTPAPELENSCHAACLENPECRDFLQPESGENESEQDQQLVAEADGCEEKIQEYIDTSASYSKDNGRCGCVDTNVNIIGAVLSPTVLMKSKAAKCLFRKVDPDTAKIENWLLGGDRDDHIEIPEGEEKRSGEIGSKLEIKRTAEGIQVYLKLVNMFGIDYTSKASERTAEMGEIKDLEYDPEEGILKFVVPEFSKEQRATGRKFEFSLTRVSPFESSPEFQNFSGQFKVKDVDGKHVRDGQCSMGGIMNPGELPTVEE